MPWGLFQDPILTFSSSVYGLEAQREDGLDRKKQVSLDAGAKFTGEKWARSPTNSSHCLSLDSLLQKIWNVCKQNHNKTLRITTRHYTIMKILLLFHHHGNPCSADAPSGQTTTSTAWPQGASQACLSHLQTQHLEQPLPEAASRWWLHLPWLHVPPSVWKTPSRRRSWSTYVPTEASGGSLSANLQLLMQTSLHTSCCNVNDSFPCSSPY